jgi:pimeloyl-ACP methyl ester carboxylesterase
MSTQTGAQPTIVLVHGAYADASSWNGVIERLQQQGYTFAINPAMIREAFAADLSPETTALMAATQRPVAAAAFTDPSGPPAWKKLPSWAVVATGDKAAGTDVVRSQAQRAGASITEVEGSHVIMISQPQAVTDVILTAARAVAASR